MDQPFIRRGKKNPYRAAKYFVVDGDGEVCDEFCARTLPMKPRRYGCRHMQTPRLAPLLRWLRSQTGRRWNEVHSDLVRHFTAGAWIPRFFAYLVEAETMMGSDQRVWSKLGLHVHCDDKRSLYVDPLTERLTEGRVNRKATS